MLEFFRELDFKLELIKSIEIDDVWGVVFVKGKKKKGKIIIVNE